MLDKNGKKKILIVDDSEMQRALLADILEDSFDILEAENGMEALAVMREHQTDVALMLLDIVMPVMDGFEVLDAMNKQGWIKTTPVIMISAESGGTFIDRAYDLGAIDYISRPFDERTVRHRVMANFMLVIKQKEMQDMLSNQIYEKEKDNSLMIEILSNIVEFRNGESGLHVLHVHAITETILKQLVKITDKYPLTNKDIRIISTASALHDIGKISIPSEILNKPGKFTPEEFAIMKNHTIEGAKMLDNVQFRKDEPLVKVSYQICRWHHERYDGRGYPDELKGDDIPIAAQVVALADVYDALTSVRCYKAAYPHDKAIEMICNGECGTFNPLLLDCLRAVADRLGQELKEFSYTEKTDSAIKESVSQLLKTDGTDVSRRLIKQIEHERMKFRYLADITNEITFEYIIEPEMIKLSDWSADSLGLPVNILDPVNDATWSKIFAKADFERFLGMIKAATPQKPVVTDKFLLNFGSGNKWYKAIAKAMWSEDEIPEFDGAICKIVDINDTTITMNQLERRAEHDSLTGLYNRGAARKQITKSLKVEPEGGYALLFFDIDDFKKANDTYGHLFGDKVIAEVAARIKRNTRSSDIAARMGGDEFVIFMELGSNEPGPLVARIYERLCGEIDGFDIKLSMGVAVTDGKIDCDSLINMADAAMYSVKYGGKHAYRFYDDGMREMLNKNGK